MGWRKQPSLLLVAVLCLYVHKVQSALQIKEFEFYEKTHKLIVDISTGFIYTGGVSYVTKLDENLNKLRDFKFESVFDTDKCFPNTTDCKEQKIFVPFKVSVLLLNNIHNYLLICGEVSQGACSLYDPNLQLMAEFNLTNHASYVGSRSSSVAFFGQPPLGEDMSQRLLYVAMATYDRQDEKFSPPTISSRLIEESKRNIDYFVNDKVMNSFSFLGVRSTVRTKFRSRYIYGFELDGEGYYVSIQPVDPDLSRTEYVTRLIRFCQNDRYYKTYMELAIKCTKGGIDYTLATAAYIDKTDDKVLIVSFGRKGVNGPDRPDTRYGSVVCNFTKMDISQRFKDVQHNCYNGGVGTYPWWVYGDVVHCIQSRVVYQDYSYCKYDLSQNRLGITGDLIDDSVMTETADVCVDEMVTAIVTTKQQEHPIVVLGTDNGYIIKASLKGGSCERNVPFMRHKLSNESIEQEMVMDAVKENVYVLAGKKLSKFPLNTCAVYKDCAACVSAKDPLGCGWCDDHCSTRDECVPPFTEWSHNSCIPYFTAIYPTSGPTEGGTLLTIRGGNFGSKSPNVTLGSPPLPCLPQAYNNTVIECITSPSTEERNFAVTVTVSDDTLKVLTYIVKGSASNPNVKFQAKTVLLTKVYPLLGPESGGTIITLHGDNLNVGQTRSVRISTNACEILSVNKTDIVVKSGSAPRLLGIGRRRRALRKDFVLLTIDNATRNSDEPYEYMTDSIIRGLHPSQTIHQGGTTVTVEGTNLHIVQHPKIAVKLDFYSKSIEGDCQVVASTDMVGSRMHCIMPNVLPYMTSSDQTKAIHVTIFFIMDNIAALLNFQQTQPDLSRFIYFPNPVIYKFDGEEKLTSFNVDEQEFLMIKGLKLNQGLSKLDYVVYIGRHECNVTTLRSDMLLCVPNPPATVSSNEQKQAVEVRVGAFFAFTVGVLIYTTTPPEGPSSTPLNIGVIVVVVILVLVILAIIILLVLMKKKRMGPFKDKSQPFHYIHGAAQLDPDDPENRMLLEQNRQNAYMYARQGSGAGDAAGTSYSTGIDEETRLMLQNQHLLVDRQYLVMGDILGAGHFGSVFKCTLKSADEETPDKIVAVKTLHQNNPREIDVKAFLTEALIMKDFKHPNVLQLIGITLGMDDMPLVILPFMKHGDLLTYIRNEENNPTIKDLIMFGIGIAEGMAYLSELKFVHRDLACRNCMLDEEFRVKVADFGLSRDIYEKDYYACENKKTMLPVKWMALECLEKGKYSSKSDVWSYGICLWELMTRGVNPYPDVDNWDIVRYLKNGRRMPQPPFAPDPLYKIMRKCWEPNPKDRPTFAVLAREVKDMITMLEQTMRQGAHKADIQSTYVNLDKCTDYHYTDELMPPGSPMSDDESEAISPKSPLVDPSSTKSPPPNGDKSSTSPLQGPSKFTLPPKSVQDSKVESTTSDEKEHNGEVKPATEPPAAEKSSKPSLTPKPHVSPKPKTSPKPVLKKSGSKEESTKVDGKEVPDVQVEPGLEKSQESTA